MMYYKGTNIDKETEYHMKNTNPEHLERLGFKYRKSMSSAEDNIYAYFFPVYRYHDAIALEARFLLHQESRVIKVDVFDSGTHGIYGPWYYDNSGIHGDLINIINSNIKREMRKMNIK